MFLTQGAALTSGRIASGHQRRPALAASRGAARGAEIRARIAHNRAKRLSIAGAMKLEAGVTGHEVNTENFGGLAFLGTGRIYSPEGSNMMQLYTVAHECGHIFLHDKPPGARLPTHVMEMEAESYAHQAFREHGMKLPEHFTIWGRGYVASWIEKDRTLGIAIDPRVQAYAEGIRSPYHALRRVPATWHRHAAEGSRLPWPLRLARAQLARGYIRIAAGLRGALTPAGAALQPYLQRERELIEEARSLVRLALRQLCHGFLLSMLAIGVLGIYVPLPDLVDPLSHMLTGQALVVATCGGLLWADLVLALRVALGPLWRSPPSPAAGSAARAEPAGAAQPQPTSAGARVSSG